MALRCNTNIFPIIFPISQAPLKTRYARINQLNYLMGNFLIIELLTQKMMFYIRKVELGD